MNFAGNIGNADIIPTDLKIIESIEVDITETKCQNMHILITQVWYQKFLRIEFPAKFIPPRLLLTALLPL